MDVRATWHCVCVLTDDGCMQMHDGRGGANVNMGVLFCACMGVRYYLNFKWPIWVMEGWNQAVVHALPATMKLAALCELIVRFLSVI